MIDYYGRSSTDPEGEAEDRGEEERRAAGRGAEEDRYAAQEGWQLFLNFYSWFGAIIPIIKVHNVNFDYY